MKRLREDDDYDDDRALLMARWDYEDDMDLDADDGAIPLQIEYPQQPQQQRYPINIHGYSPRKRAQKRVAQYERIIPNVNQFVKDYNKYKYIKDEITKTASLLRTHKAYPQSATRKLIVSLLLWKLSRLKSDAAKQFPRMDQKVEAAKHAYQDLKEMNLRVTQKGGYQAKQYEYPVYIKDQDKFVVYSRWFSSH